MRAISLNSSEESIQKAVMDWVRLHPLIKRLIIHIPNEGKRSPRYGKILKDMGMRAGVSDLFIAMARHGFNGAWIELKSKTGRLTKEQTEFLEDMKAQNYYTSVQFSLEETIDLIKWYCFDF